MQGLSNRAILFTERREKFLDSQAIFVGFYSLQIVFIQKTTQQHARKFLDYYLLTLISAEEKVGKGGEDGILDFQIKVEGESLTIEGDPVVEEGGIYGEGMYFLYFIVYVY